MSFSWFYFSATFSLFFFFACVSLKWHPVDENVMTKDLPLPNHALFPLGTTVPSLLMQCS